MGRGVVRGGQARERGPAIALRQYWTCGTTLSGRRVRGNEGLKRMWSREVYGTGGMTLIGEVEGVLDVSAFRTMFR